MGVASKDPFEMPFVHDQKVVKALRSKGTYEPFGKSVGIRGPKGRLQDLGSLGPEDLVEARHYLVSRSRTKNLALMSATARSLVTFLACRVAHAACA
jgi:hypothetical protein